MVITGVQEQDATFITCRVANTITLIVGIKVVLSHMDQAHPQEALIVEVVVVEDFSVAVDLIILQTTNVINILIEVEHLSAAQEEEDSVAEVYSHQDMEVGPTLPQVITKNNHLRKVGTQLIAIIQL